MATESEKLKTGPVQSGMRSLNLFLHIRMIIGGLLKEDEIHAKKTSSQSQISKSKGTRTPSDADIHSPIKPNT